MPVRFSSEHFPRPPEPFTRRHQFSATLSLREKTIQEEVVLDWDDLGRSQPHGYVLGNNETHEALNGLDDSRLPRGVRITSKELGLETLADFSLLRKRGPGQGPIGIIGHFRSRTVTQEDRFEETAFSRRVVTFFLQGPREHWPTWYSRELSYTGDTKTKIYEKELPLDLDLPLRLEVTPHFFYSEIESKEQEQTVSADVVAVTASIDMSRAELSDDDFVRTATEVIDDCCLLVSFLAGSWTTWYGYALQAGDRLVQHHRAARFGRDTDSQDTPVPTHQTAAFLKTAVGRLRQLRKEGKEPRLALRHAIAAAEARSFEERFLSLFLALESLKDLYARSRDRELTMPKKRFDKVQRALRSALADTRNDPAAALTDDQLASVERKLPDLNRPAFAEILEEMLQHYGVEWRDLYPPATSLTRPRFISIRDTLIHTGSIVSPKVLEIEMIRLQGVVERVLLRTLGWEDTFCSPRTWFHGLLRTQMGDEPEPAVP